MPNLTKLDAYDYTVLPGVIQVALDGTNDPTMVDILSELERSEGYLYVEGGFYLYYDYSIVSQNTHPALAPVYLELKVVPTQ